MKQKIEPVTLNENDKLSIPLNRIFNNQSEMIVKYCLEKIIINCAWNLYVADLEDQIPEHCINSIFKVLNCATKFEFMQHDKNDLDFKELNKDFEFDINNELELDKENIMLDDFIENVNNWEDIEMPNCSNIDREASSTIKVKKEIKEIKEIKQSKFLIKSNNQLQQLNQEEEAIIILLIHIKIMSKNLILILVKTKTHRKLKQQLNLDL